MMSLIFTTKIRIFWCQNFFWTFCSSLRWRNAWVNKWLPAWNFSVVNILVRWIDKFYLTLCQHCWLLWFQNFPLTKFGWCKTVEKGKILVRFSKTSKILSCISEKITKKARVFDPNFGFLGNKVYTKNSWNMVNRQLGNFSPWWGPVGGSASWGKC